MCVCVCARAPNSVVSAGSATSGPARATNSAVPPGRSTVHRLVSALCASLAPKDRILLAGAPPSSPPAWPPPADAASSPLSAISRLSSSSTRSGVRVRTERITSRIVWFTTTSKAEARRQSQRVISSGIRAGTPCLRAPRAGHRAEPGVRLIRQQA